MEGNRQTQHERLGCKVTHQRWTHIRKKKEIDGESWLQGNPQMVYMSREEERV
jgi:hypothetical protein